MKKIALIILTLLLFFIVSCQKIEKEVDEKLDGIYELMEQYDVNNRFTPYKSPKIYDEYTLNIKDNVVILTIKYEGQQKSEETLKINIYEDSFTIETYNENIFYFSPDFSYIERVNNSIENKFEEKLYFKKVGQTIELDAKEYIDKTYEITSASGYYKRYRVTNEFFLTFEISFINEKNVKVEIISKEFSYTKSGIYKDYLKSIVIECDDEIIILDKESDKLSFSHRTLNFPEYGGELGLNQFNVKLHLKIENPRNMILDLEYKYDEKIYDEIVQLTRPILNHESNKLNVSYQLLSSNLKSTYHKTNNHIVINDWSGNHNHSVNGYLLQLFEGAYYAVGYTSTLPEFDLFSNMNHDYQFSKINETYYVKVNSKKFAFSQTLPSIYNNSPIASFQLDVDMYLKINVLETELNVEFFDQNGTLFLKAIYTNEHDSDALMESMIQSYALNIEQALIPLKLDYTYNVLDSYLNDPSNFDRENYVKLDLEPGFYYFTGNNIYTAVLCDSNERFLFDRMVSFGNDTKIFGFEVLEDSEPLYISISSHSKENYNYIVKKVANFDLISKSYQEGRQEINVVDTPNAIHIQKTFDTEKSIKVEFIPLKDQMGLIRVNGRIGNDIIPFDILVDVNSEKPLDIKIYTSGTLIITVLD